MPFALLSELVKMKSSSMPTPTQSERKSPRSHESSASQGIERQRRRKGIRGEVLHADTHTPPDTVSATVPEVTELAVPSKPRGIGLQRRIIMAPVPKESRSSPVPVQ